MADFYTLLTNDGRAKLAAALAAGVPLAFHEMALGDGNGNPVTPLATMTTLVHEVYRAALNSVTLDQTNPNRITCELIVPPTAGGWSIRECGIFDDDGTLIAIGNFPETYKPAPGEGAARDLVIRNVMAVENTGAVNLEINAEIVTATQDWVVTQITNFITFNDGRYEPLGAVAAHNIAVSPHVGKFEPLGAVAAHDTAVSPHVGKFDPYGTAAAMVDAHEAESNPHSQYLRVWTSGDYDIPATGGTLLNVNHGLTLNMSRAHGFVCFKCVTADAGYTAGDIVTSGAQIVAGDSYFSPPVAGLSSTSIWSHISYTAHANTVWIPNKTTGLAQSITRANWVRFFKIFY